ncbi:MAG: GAF domain-containing protein [Chloroflexi bacterium]|nr:MAG: GAF domain-containing protein [Chloroflexota bacterium]
MRHDARGTTIEGAPARKRLPVGVTCSAPARMMEKEGASIAAGVGSTRPDDIGSVRRSAVGGSLMMDADDSVLATPLAAAEGVQWHERLSALRNLTQELTRPLDLDELFGVIHRELATILRAEAFFFALFHEASQTVEVVRQVESGVELAGGSFPVGSGLTSQVISSRRSQLIRRWSENGPPVHVQYASQTPGLPESAILAPLVYGEHVLGVLAVYSYQPDSFDRNDLLALEVVATQTAMAVANLRHSDYLS